MSKWRVATILLAIIGAALIAVAIVYWVEPAGSLPSFFPGHLVGSAHKHLKHGAVAAAAGIIVWIGAWMASARK